ncbi:precorrin-6A synthase (deacetylating) [Nakamurella endophytica]|uniref:Precorrin-6A synthase (Deacetylating) n=1 Tax=Nakamurella endophytica TaxID=1748367 RepID=A0A917SLJ5_9ACTN|nr:precorrin-6A synthase (deacetylating) [Nakamurella endophytica]GGL85319.1 precorrin-6A synthase (deacetylating) [Nakamurella endophytica]
MKLLWIIGIGPGDPEQITLQAVAALGATDVVFAVDKADGADVSELAALRDELCRRHAAPGHRVVHIADPPRERRPADYAATVADWHGARADRYEAAFAGLGPDEVGAFLVLGDPGWYDSTIRIVEQVLARGTLDFDWRVVPGVTSVSALAAAHRTVLHGVGRPLLVTTGRRLTDGTADGFDDVAVLLDGGLACEDLPDGGEGLDIFWGANVGTPGETLVAGPLPEVLPRIAAVRAAVRAARGWVLDTYLLRRRR